MVFRRLFPVLAAAAAVQLMTGSAVFAGTYDDGSFTITATSSQLTTTFLGASTFADSDTFANYSGSVTTPVATITGGQLNPGGSTNPDSGISSSIANYLAASSGSTETIAFNSNQKYFGMLWGSVDTTNTVSIYENNTLLASYTGSELNSSVGLQYYSAPGLRRLRRRQFRPGLQQDRLERERHFLRDGQLCDFGRAGSVDLGRRCLRICHPRLCRLCARGVAVSAE